MVNNSTTLHILTHKFRINNYKLTSLRKRPKHTHDLNKTESRRLREKEDTQQTKTMVEATTFYDGGCGRCRCLCTILQIRKPHSSLPPRLLIQNWKI